MLHCDWIEIKEETSTNNCVNLLLSTDPLARYTPQWSSWIKSLRLTNKLFLNQTIRVIPQEIGVGEVKQLDAILLPVVIVIIRLARRPGSEAEFGVGSTPSPQLVPIHIIPGSPVIQDLEPIYGGRSKGAALEIVLQLLILYLWLDFQQLQVYRPAIRQGIEPCLLLETISVNSAISLNWLSLRGCWRRSTTFDLLQVHFRSRCWVTTERERSIE